MQILEIRADEDGYIGMFSSIILSSFNVHTLFPLKLRGASSHSMNARKAKGEEKMPQMNETNDKLTVK